MLIDYSMQSITLQHCITLLLIPAYFFTAEPNNSFFIAHEIEFIKTTFKHMNSFILYTNISSAKPQIFTFLPKSCN